MTPARSENASSLIWFFHHSHCVNELFSEEPYI